MEMRLTLLTPYPVGPLGAAAVIHHFVGALFGRVAGSLRRLRVFVVVPHLKQVLTSHFTELPWNEQSSGLQEGTQGSTSSQAPLSLATCNFDFARVLTPFGLVGVGALRDDLVGSDFLVTTRSPTI